MIARLLLIFLLFSVCAYPQTIAYKSLSADDGLPGGTIYYVLQDSDGYIWFGTKNGVIRWDSKEFKIFTIEDGLPNNEVIYIYEGPDKRIWFSCFSEELSYYYNGKIYNRKSDAALGNIEIYPGSKILQINHDLYFSSFDRSLCKYNFDTRKKTNVNIFTLSKYYYLINDGNKVLFIDFANRKQNFLRSEEGSIITHSFYQPNFPDGKILTKIDYTKKMYYFQYGLHAPFDSSRYRFDDFKLALFNKGNIVEAYENRLEFKGDNHLINVSYKGFPLIFSSKDYLFFFGSENVLVNHQHPVLEFKTGEGYGNDFKYLYFDKDKVYGINTTYQIVDLKNKRIVNKIDDDIVNSHNILDCNGAFLLNTSSSVYRLTGKSVAGLNGVGLSNFKYLSLISNRPDWFYCAIGYKGVFAVNFKEQKKQAIYEEKGVPVYSVFEDHTSRLWFSSLNKVFYKENGKANTGNIKTLVLDTTIATFCNKIDEDRNGNLFFTTNAGIFVFDGTYKYKIDKTNLLTDNICNKLLLSLSDSSFWVASPFGLNHIRYFKQNGRLQFEIINRFFKADGLHSNVVNDILFFNKAIYIATNKGVNVIENLNYRPTRQSIPIYLRLSAINGSRTKTAVQHDLQLNNRQNSLTYTFAALYFLRRDRLKITSCLYRNNILIAQNEVAKDEIDYNSLNDGSYKLIIKAYDRDYPYIKGQSSSFCFTISPPYYKRVWFILSLSLVAVFGISGLLTWNFSRRKNRQLREAMLNSELNRSTLKSLQSQMNPHFVFNSLNTIQYFITSRKEEAALNYLSDFSSLIREMLEQSRNAFINLEDEIQFLRKYLHLENVRFNEGFEVIWDIRLTEDDLAEIQIPTMLIQPVLENAIKHGISNLTATKGKIEIELSLEDAYMLLVKVTDNGVAAKKISEKGNLVAVQAIKDRLRVYTKNGKNGAYHLTIIETGAIATITIPI